MGRKAVKVRLARIAFPTFKGSGKKRRSPAEEGVAIRGREKGARFAIAGMAPRRAVTPAPSCQVSEAKKVAVAAFLIRTANAKNCCRGVAERVASA